MPRNRSALVWGQGLDRATGNLVVDAATFLDVRNLLVRDSKLMVRGGLVTAAGGGALDDCTDVVGGFPFRTTGGSVLVGYNRSTLLLTIWRLDAYGGLPIYVGDWDTLPDGAPLPMISGAEVNGKMFLAHAERLYNYRAKTVYFDPSLLPGAQVLPLTSDLDGDTDPEEIHFRGVKAWLDYLVGYGYGTGTDENRPETVRVSDPGNPLNFSKESYFLASVRQEPVTGLLENGGFLRVQKGGEALRIKGTGTADFGIVPLEQVYGQVNDRLGVTIGEEAVFWSEQGPRIATGGASVDIALPLELDGPEPADLAAAGDTRYGWCVYDPSQRNVIFGFPVLDPVNPITRCYVLSRRDPNLIRWTYFEIQQPIYCAWMLTQGIAIIGSVPTGYVDNVVVVDAGTSGTARAATATWDVHSLLGGEVAQIWIRPDGGDWRIAGSVDAASETAAITGVEPLDDFDVVVRCVLDGITTAGYEGSNPDAWTAGTVAGASTTFTSSGDAPSGVSIAWSRESALLHKVVLSFTLAELGVGIRLEESPNGTTGWVEVEADFPHDARTLTHYLSDALLGLTKYYRLTAYRSSEDSAHSAVVSVYIGPLALPDPLTVVQRGTGRDFDLWLRSLGDPGNKLEVQTSADGATAWTSRFNSASYSLKQNVDGARALPAVTYVRVRMLVPSFGIDDAGAWVAAGNLTLTTNVIPAALSVFTGQWVSSNLVSTTFNVGPSGDLVLIEFVKTDQKPTIATTVSDAATSLNLTTIRDTGIGGWVPYVFGTMPPSESLIGYRIDTSGGQRKLSAGLIASVVMTFDGPTNTTPSQPTVGLPVLQVNWDNTAVSGSTAVFWRKTVDSGLMSALNDPVAVAGPNDVMTGPGAGYRSMETGAELTVRTCHLVSGRYSKPSDATFSGLIV